MLYRLRQLHNQFLCFVVQLAFDLSVSHRHVRLCLGLGHAVRNSQRAQSVKMISFFPFGRNTPI